MLSREGQEIIKERGRVPSSLAVELALSRAGTTWDRTPLTMDTLRRAVGGLVEKFLRRARGLLRINCDLVAAKFRRRIFRKLSRSGGSFPLEMAA